MSGIITDERLLADFACLEPIYADGVAGVLNLGENFALYFYRWVPSKSEHGAVIMEKAAVATIIRPRTSVTLCKQANCTFLKWIEAAVPRPQTGMH